MIELAFELGSTLYVKVDKEQQPYILIAVTMALGGTLTYGLSDGRSTMYCYEAELSETKNLTYG